MQLQFDIPITTTWGKAIKRLNYSGDFSCTSSSERKDVMRVRKTQRPEGVSKKTLRKLAAAARKEAKERGTNRKTN